LQKLINGTADDTHQRLRNQAAIWPTPYGVTGNHGPDGNEFSTMVRNWQTPKAATGDYQYVNGEKFLNLEGEVKNWPSPRSEDSESCGNHPNAMDSLTGAAANLWNTPNSGQGGNSSRSGERIDEPLLRGQAVIVRNLALAWPTLAARDFKGAKNELPTHNARPLNEVAKVWGTPSAHDRKSTPREVDHGIQLANQVAAFSPPAQLPTGEPSQKRSGRRLNPAFVSWLMGSPWYWTRAEPISFAAQETASWRSKLLSRLLSLCGEPV